MRFQAKSVGCEAEMMSMLATKLPDGVDPDVAAGCRIDDMHMAHIVLDME